MNDINQGLKKILLLSLLLVPLSVSALTREKQVINTLTGINTTIGVNYSNGDYGTGVDNQVLTIPFDIYYRTGNWNFGVATSYLSTDGTGTTLPNYGGGPMGGGSSGQLPPGMRPPGSGGTPTVTYSGLGDTTASANYIIQSLSNPTKSVYVTGKVKFPTADETKSLGTGEMDYNLEMGFYSRTKGPAIYGTAGYQITGDPAGTDYKNVLYGTMGMSYPLENNKSAGVSLYASESIFPGGDAPLEVDFSFRTPIDKNRWLNAFAGAGLSDGSPDFIAGFNIEFAF
ncbi:MAG: hypothetical protein ACC653_11415 [Gammaproteobacteria bacterium]